MQWTPGRFKIRIHLMVMILKINMIMCDLVLNMYFQLIKARIFLYKGDIWECCVCGPAFKAND